MKRLLLPLLAAFALPTAVNAFPFGDVVVKTDVGEKYIAKHSTVWSWNYSKMGLLEFTKENSPLKKYKKCVEVDKWGKRSCKNIYLKNNAAENYEKEIKIINNLKPEKLFSIVHFKPIYVDLNGNKRALKEHKFACINNELEPQEAKYINWVIGYKMVTYSEIYSREFKKKICNKYFWN